MIPWKTLRNNLSFWCLVAQVTCNRQGQKACKLTYKVRSGQLTRLSGHVTTWSAQLSRWPAQLSRWPAQLIRLSGHLTRWSAQLTRWSGQLTRWSGQLTRWPAQLIRLSGHLTRWSAQLTRWSGQLTRWSGQLTRIWYADPGRVCDYVGLGIHSEDITGVIGVRRENAAKGQDHTYQPRGQCR